MAVNIRPRPDYCPDDLREDEDCPACGEPPSGFCRARFNRPEPKPLLSVVLIDRRTGKIV